MIFTHCDYKNTGLLIPDKVINYIKRCKLSLLSYSIKDFFPKKRNIFYWKFKYMVFQVLMKTCKKRYYQKKITLLT